MHLTEYERPHDRIAGQHEAWLDLMAKTASQTLDIAADRVFLKRRLRQREIANTSVWPIRSLSWWFAKTI
ncbi:MAG: hypothetical protein R3C28_09560 [Pirellulaceae bacterium]